MNRSTSILLGIVILAAAAFLIYSYTQKDEMLPVEESGAVGAATSGSGGMTSGSTGTDATGGSVLDRIRRAVLDEADLGTTTANVTVATEDKEWSDSCLGLGRANESCAQVLTRGYEVTVTRGEETRVFRTNSDGTVIREDTSQADGGTD